MGNDLEKDDLRTRLNIPSGIPELVNKRIDDTLKNLEDKKKSARFAKKSIVILAACMSITGIYTLAVFGQKLPVIKSLVQFINPSAARNYEVVKKEVSDIDKKRAASTKKTVVNKSVTDKGITLTVNDMSYDGATLIVGFNISKQDGFDIDKDEIEVDLFSGFNTGKFIDISLTRPDPNDKKAKSLKKDMVHKNGQTDKPQTNTMRKPEIISPSSFNSYVVKQDSSNYKGYAVFYFGDLDSQVPEDSTLTLVTREIVNVSGEWKIDTGIMKKDIYIAPQITQQNDVHKFKYGTVDSVKVIKSALNNIICLRGVYNKKSEDIKLGFPGFFVMDDKGKCLNYSCLTDSVFQDGKFVKDISLMNISNDTKKLTVIPFQRISSEEKQYTADITKLPALIKIQDKQINIKNVQRSKGKIAIQYTIDGLTEDRNSPYFGFQDKKGKKINSLNDNPKRIVPMDYETGIGNFELVTDKAEDIEKVVGYGFDYELMSDYKFEVELK